MAIVLVVAVVAVAYGSAAPQLGVAEFAPAARQAVEPPPTTAADSAAAGGGAGGRRSSTSASTTTSAPAGADPSDQSSVPTTRVSRTRACVGSPPRQTEDPQSPPCVAAIFEADNGGSTSRGVSETEIRVAVPVEAGTPDLVQLLFDYFNLRFELYGRRLVPVPMPYLLSDPVAQRATADEVAAAGAFAALDMYMGFSSPTVSFHQALARNGVITMVGRDAPFSDSVLFDEWHPYIWGVNPSLEVVWQATAGLICTALAGRPASHAGPSLQTTTRKFGVVVESQYSAAVPLTLGHQHLLAALDQCGVAPKVVNVTQLSGDQGRLAMTSLRDAGVTSIVCACEFGPPDMVFAAVAAGGYEPELLLPNLVYSSEAIEADLLNYQGAAANAPHVARIFGVYQTPKLLPYQVRPFFAAFREMSASFDLTVALGSSFRRLEAMYRQLLVLASGIQGAGPSLSPDAFGQALMTMQFPNPGAGQAPFWQPAVGFGPGDHTFHDDVALAWWNPALTTTVGLASFSGRPGSWCFLGGGTRFKPSQIPADADKRFFDPSEPAGERPLSPLVSVSSRQ